MTRLPFALLLSLLSTASLTSAQAATAHHLDDFEGLEEPVQWYTVECDCFKPHEPGAHITEPEPGVFRMALHFSAASWDGDRTTKDKGRQRSEVKGLGPHQRDGETFEYLSTWRTSPDFKASKRFCHIFQLKATDGDKGAPLVTETLNEKGAGEIRLWSGTGDASVVARTFSWTLATWKQAKIQIKVSRSAEGFVKASFDGDPLDGKTDLPVYRPEAADYRPKWGLYRAVNKTLALGDAYIEHKDVQTNALMTK
jgi:hypothetical protein